MNLKIDKIKTYVGFAVKSGEFVIGIDEVLKQKRLELIIVSNSLQPSSKSKVEAYAKKSNVKLLAFDGREFDFVTNMTNVKVFGLKNKNLASAIKKLYSE